MGSDFCERRTTIGLTALRLTQDAVVVYDANGQIVEWSDAASELYGWGANDAIGRHAPWLFGSAVVGVGDQVSGVDERRRRDGAVIDVEWRRQAVDGHPDLVVEVGRLAAPRRDPQDELARYRGLYRGAGAAVWEHDWSGVWEATEELCARGVTDFRRFLIDNPAILADLSSRVRILDANDEAVRLFEARSRDDLVNGPLPRIFTDDTRASFTRSLSSLIERRPRIESECGFITLRGNPLRIALRISALDERQWKRIVVTMIDVTERTRAQQALNQALDELAHISRITTLGELTASIAHELNQPLVAIVTEGQGALRWLRRDQPNLAEAEEGISRAVNAAVRAGEVMQRLRAMAKKGEREMSRISLGDVVEEAAQLVHRELVRREVTLRLEKANVPDIVGDRIQLQQVAINLMINAAQAMEKAEGRPRQLVVSLTEPGPGRSGFEVFDTGPGVAEQDQDALFRPFYSTKSNGMGLGLSICRSIVEAHNGRIWLQNRNAGGAVAGISIPTVDNAEDLECRC